MRALTLWQPWATLVAIGAKRYETRSWRTHYRGRIAIHAAQKILRPMNKQMRVALEEKGLEWQTLPKGKILAVVRLETCRPTESTFILDSDPERAYGDFHGGRYAWYFVDILKLKNPIPIRGKQRLWNLSHKITETLRAQHEQAFSL